jgi:Tfp pilus assembly protein PilO
MTKTNEFFVEQSQNISVTATDEQLVNFLYKLGSGASMIRVRDLELQPDSARTRLNANIQLVASYQKNPSAPARAATPAAVPAGSKPITKTVR